GTARRICEPLSGVQPLDEGGRGQCVATARSVLGSNPRNQEPGNRIWVDHSRVAGLHLAPDGARVPVLPGGANRATRGHHLWISVWLKRVGAEEVGRDLPAIFAEQGGLGCEENKLEAAA